MDWPAGTSPDPAVRRSSRPSVRLLATLPALILPLATLGCAGDRYVEMGDLPEIREHGRLRILMPPLEPRGFPRQGYAISHEREMARQLARDLDLDPVIVTVQARDALVTALLEGRGDLVLGRLTITEERRSRLAFSEPLGHVRELVVVRAGDDFIRGPADLDGCRVGVRASSSFHGTLTRLHEQVTGLQIVTMDEHLDMEEILSRVADGELEAAVADDDLAAQILTWRRDLQPAFYLTGPRPVAWAMRPGSTELKAAVDRFLHDQALLREPETVALGDLERIRKRRVLRVLTRNNAATTFLHRGKQVGFEYELIRKFARSIGCRVQLVIPPGFQDLLPWLMEGRGDIVAASLVATPDRRRRAALTRPYLNARQLVVTRTENASVLRGPADLAGRRVAVRASSVYHRTLESLQDEGGIPVEIQVVPESTETEDLIAEVADGTYDATLAVSHIFSIARAWQPGVVGAFGLGKPLEIAWAIRPEDTKLLEAADGFLKTHGRGTTFLNVLRQKYFTDAARISRRVRERPEITGRISRYDGLFRKYGAETGIDWRLLAAQAYQESRFRPAARSWSGAVGIMQVLPRTAREMGVDGDYLDPENSIRAGALYLKYLAETQYMDLPLTERLRFALAAYNAGPGHIRDGRKLARERGLDPDIWFGSLDRVLPDLSLRVVASKARYGYCRCRETVEYVGAIEERYKRYRQALD